MPLPRRRQRRIKNPSAPTPAHPTPVTPLPPPPTIQDLTSHPIPPATQHLTQTTITYIILAVFYIIIYHSFTTEQWSRAMIFAYGGAAFCLLRGKKGALLVIITHIVYLCCEAELYFTIVPLAGAMFAVGGIQGGYWTGVLEAVQVLGVVGGVGRMWWKEWGVGLILEATVGVVWGVVGAWSRAWEEKVRREGVGEEEEGEVGERWWEVGGDGKPRRR